SETTVSYVVITRNPPPRCALRHSSRSSASTSSAVVGDGAGDALCRPYDSLEIGGELSPQLGDHDPVAGVGQAAAQVVLVVVNSDQDHPGLSSLEEVAHRAKRVPWYAMPQATDDHRCCRPLRPARQVRSEESDPERRGKDRNAGSEQHGAPHWLGG